MKIYPLNLDKDYDVLVRWWEGYGWPAPSKDILPTNGFIVKKDEVGVVAGFCYKTDSSMMLFEWIIGNPNIEKETRKDGQTLLIRFVKLWAKTNGFNYLFTMTKNSGLEQRLLDNGFKKTDIDVSHFVGGIE